MDKHISGSHRHSGKIALHISSLEFNKWFRSSRLIILAVIAVFIQVQIVNPLSQCVELMGEPVSIPEGFLALSNSGLILLILPLLFLVLIADFPQKDGAHLFCQIRCSKKSWVTGQILFAAKSSLFLLVFLFAITCILMSKCGSWQWDYSHAVTHFAATYPDQSSSYIVQLVPGNLYQQISFGMALLHSACLMYLHFMMIALIILLCFLCHKKLTGILINAALIILGTITCEVKMNTMWLFPLSHTISWVHYQEYLNEMLFPMWGSYLYLAAGCAGLMIACLALCAHYHPID